MGKAGYILFDMDGVLIDSKESIIETNRAVLQHYGVSVDENTLRKVVGPPLHLVYSEYFGFEQERIPDAIKRYRELYDTRYIKTVRVFDGVAGILRELTQAGYALYVATSRDTAVSVNLLKKLNMDSYFTEIVGLSEGRNTKEYVIGYILNRLPAGDRGNAVMVGDREMDVDAAAAYGIKTIGASYGYGSPEELRNAAIVVNTATDIAKCFPAIYKD